MRPQLRTTIEVRGARVHNLRNVSVEIPRDQLVVFTGVSGSGKSSLAFDTIYAEGQRRYLESLSSFVRNFVEQVEKPDVDRIAGLSPVVSIAQKTSSSNPRSTVGTMTETAGYLNLLFATLGRGKCARCEQPLELRSLNQVVEIIMNQPVGSRLELRAPLWTTYGEDLTYTFNDLRKKGYRTIVLGHERFRVSDDLEFAASEIARLEVLIDEIVVLPELEKSIRGSVEQALQTGERYVSIVTENGRRLGDYEYRCSDHGYLMAGVSSEDFIFNNPKSACRTCLGLGATMKVHPQLLVPDPSRSIAGGAFVPEAFRNNRDTYDGKLMYSLAQWAGFSLDTPWAELNERARDMVLFGTNGEKFTLMQPPGAKEDTGHQVGQLFKWDGIANRIERHYRWYREKDSASTQMEDYLSKVMVEVRCPDCGGARLRGPRMNVRIGGFNTFELGEMSLATLAEFLDGVSAEGPRREAARQVLKEVRSRLGMLVEIGLDYLNLNRRSSTLSGGESQRIRLSTQIGSGLMGMLYVLDEPSIGLHPKDTAKLIRTLHRLRDQGNSVLVVEHDEDTIRAADWVVELGPGAGVHGGTVVASCAAEEFLHHPTSHSAAFLAGRRSIHVPSARRKPGSAAITIYGARENNLKNLTVRIPLGVMVAVTGASGSGKSSLVNEILFKGLHAHLVDSRTIPGEHDRIEGLENVAAVTRIDQSPIGRSPRSNPATYVGIYDEIRKVFAAAPLAQERGYTASRFSFNVRGGRCEECTGNGTVTERLSFMPDVESVCEACKGRRFTAETLEVLVDGKSIADVLEMSIEDGVSYFAAMPTIGRRLAVLHQLGLGYLTLGQSATTLSGGEAQRVKLAAELSKLRRGGRTLYILDEPTTGLHWLDIERLLECLNGLVAAGNTVIVIEHQMEVVKCADWVIDLGPEGGSGGGELLVEGTPETVAACEPSFTGQHLRRHLAR